MKQLKTNARGHYKADRRYTITYEWCGHPEPRFVVRFCDEWLGQHRLLTEAVGQIRTNLAERAAILSGAVA